MSHSNGHGKGHEEHGHHGSPLPAILSWISAGIVLIPLLNEAAAGCLGLHNFSAQWIVNNYSWFFQRWAILWLCVRLLLQANETIRAILNDDLEVEDLYNRPSRAFFWRLGKCISCVWLAWASVCVARPLEAILVLVVLAHALFADQFDWKTVSWAAKAALLIGSTALVFGLFFADSKPWWQSFARVSLQQDDGRLTWDQLDWNKLPADYPQVDHVVALDCTLYIQSGGVDIDAYINGHRYPALNQPGGKRMEIGPWWFPQPKVGQEDPTSYWFITDVNGDGYLDIVVAQPGYDHNRGRIGVWLAHGGHFGYPGEESGAGGLAHDVDPSHVLFGLDYNSRMGERIQQMPNGSIRFTQYIAGTDCGVYELGWRGGRAIGEKPGKGEEVSVWTGAVQGGLSGIPEARKLTTLSFQEVRTTPEEYRELLHAHPSEYYMWGADVGSGYHPRVFFRRSTSIPWEIVHDPLKRNDQQLSLMRQYLHGWRMDVLTGGGATEYPRGIWRIPDEVVDHQYAGDK